MGNSVELSNPNVLTEVYWLQRLKFSLLRCFVSSLDQKNTNDQNDTQSETFIPPAQVIKEVLTYANSLARTDIPLETFPNRLKKYVEVNYNGVPIIIDPETSDIYVYKKSFATRIFFNILARTRSANAILTE